MPSLLDPKSEYLINSGYVGDVARATDKEMQENESRIAESDYLSPASSCYEKLVGIAGECSKSGWDGYAAVPIPGEVYFKIASLISNFPLGLQAPELVPENDGAITLEWNNSCKQELSVSINSSNIVYYAFVDGSEKRHGSYVVQKSLSPFLTHMVDQASDT